MTVIKTLDGLKKYREIIELFFGEYGKIYLQNYLSFEANFKSKKKNTFWIFIDNDNQLLSAFEKKSDSVWQCSIPGYPILGKGRYEAEVLVNFLSEVCKLLKIKTLYLPLVYKENKYLPDLLATKWIYSWSRLPSPIIRGDLTESTIWERVQSRYGSRARRQKKKFENRLYIKTIKIDEVEKIVEKIETNSWKRNYKQDMLSRDNQFEYYTNIIKSGLADISVAFDQKTEEAVAFRIDSLTGGVLFVLKWSYDEKYTDCSPGFYLLTVDLFRKYSKKQPQYIDLYGSPDMLKDLLETDRLERVDICYSTNPNEVEIIRDERTKFDEKIFINYKKQKSIKGLFYEKQN
ncbi:MAG: GNAT family N-acetyltransferase [Candidatus Shapirobacteria bacterium]